MSKLFVGDTGTTITLDSGQSLSGYTATIKYVKPTGATGSWSAIVSGNTAYYVTLSTDLDVAGVWKLQLYVTKAGVWTGHGEIVTITVENTI